MGMGEQKLRLKDCDQKIDEGTDQEVEIESALVYECVRQPEDLPVAKGTKVRLVDMKNEILVFRGTRNIGYVAPGHDDTLRAHVGPAQRKLENSEREAGSYANKLYLAFVSAVSVESTFHKPHFAAARAGGDT